jgi:hypothetical protein
VTEANQQQHDQGRKYLKPVASRNAAFIEVSFYLSSLGNAYFSTILIMATGDTPTVAISDDAPTTAQSLHPVTHWEQLNEVCKPQLDYW